MNRGKRNWNDTDLAAALARVIEKRQQPRFLLNAVYTNVLILSIRTLVCTQIAF